MAQPHQQVSKDALTRLTEFSDEMRSALVLGDVNQWAEGNGLVRRTDAIKTTFPLPISAAGYKELLGDITFRHLGQRSMSMTTKRWTDGVEEFADVLEAPDFIDWAGEPARMALEWQRQPNTLVAEMLALNTFDGPLLDLYRDTDTNTASTLNLFDTHLNNVLDSSAGTFVNFTTTTVAAIKDGSFFSAVNAHFRGLKGPNGKNLGLKMDGGKYLLPAAREELFKDVLESDTLIRAVNAAGAVGSGSGNVAAVTQNNRFKGTAFEVGDELTSDNYVYALAAGRPGLYPWVVQISAALEEIRHDKDSDHYKRTLKVAQAYIGKMAVAAAMPQGILRVEITG